MLSFLQRASIPAIAFLLFGCSGEAPHDNPLDPLSSHYVAGGVVSGHIVLKNLVTIPVPGALVSTFSGSLATLSDSSGNFAFATFPVGSTSLVISKEGFMPDTLVVTLAPGGQQSYQVALNALPVISSTRVTTSRIAVWFPSTRYSAFFAATVADLNGIADIDSVWLSVDSLLFPLAYSVTDKDFQLTMQPYLLPGNNLQTLVGKPLRVVARDLGRAVGSSPPIYVSRIIEEEPLPVYPTSIPTTDTVVIANTGLVFRWSEPKATFGYTYSLYLARVDNANNETVVWSVTGVPSYLLAYTYSGPSLMPGNYSWTLSFVDDLGNSSTSKEYAFVVL